MTASLTVEQASKVWDILIEHAGADEPGRDAFVHHQTRGCDEYRFMGWLGFGGKFWNARDRWYVNTYPEELTPGRSRIIEITNAALAGLKASVDALDAVLGRVQAGDAPCPRLGHGGEAVTDAELLRRERENCGHGRDGHLDETDLELIPQAISGEWQPESQ